MKSGELLKKAGIAIPVLERDSDIEGICYNSKLAKPGDLFVCVRGFTTDGHKYALSAQEAGAVMILAERELPEVTVPVVLVEDGRKALSAVSAVFFGDPTKSMRIFGITGTNGKTTISYLLRAIVEASGHECAVLGTIAYVYGGKVRESARTTPESLELQQMFHEMKDEYGIEYCAMEVSSHSLALSRAADIDFDYSVFTNLTEDHLDFHKDLEDYYQAKKKLFLHTSGCSVINIDDPYGKRLFRELKEAGFTVYSCAVEEEEADYRASVVSSSASGTVAEILDHGKKLGVLRINTPGRFSVANAVCAAGVTLAAGISWCAVRAGIEQTPGVAGRFERVSNSRNIPVIVDYAHTPDALEKVLKTTREFTEGRIITVFGCGGDRDREKRPLMGKAAGTLSDLCIVTSDNPRTEDPQTIIEEILPGVFGTDCEYIVEQNRREAIRRALQEYRDKDTIIVAGKGHEDYQIIGKEKHHFDDRETVKEIIEREMGS